MTVESWNACAAPISMLAIRCSIDSSIADCVRGLSEAMPKNWAWSAADRSPVQFQQWAQMAGRQRKERGDQTLRIRSHKKKRDNFSGQKFSRGLLKQMPVILYHQPLLECTTTRGARAAQGPIIDYEHKFVFIIVCTDHEAKSGTPHCTEIRI